MFFSKVIRFFLGQAYKKVVFDTSIMKKKRSDSMLRVIGHLRDNGRKSCSHIARKEGLATSTVFEHVRNCESNVILRYVSLIDFQQLGFTFHRVFFLRHPKTHSFVEWLRNQPQLNNVRLCNDMTLIVEGFFSSLADEESFHDSLRARGAVVTSGHHVLEPLALEKWVPDAYRS